MSLWRNTKSRVRDRKVGRHGALTALAVAGIAGPILFWALLLLTQSLHPGYDAFKDSISRLTLGPFGWLQTMNFCLLTLFTAAFGVAVYIFITKSLTGRLASLLLVIMGLTQLLTAVFRVDVNSFGPKSIAYSIHNWVFIVSAGSFPFGALLLVPNLWSDKNWRPLAYITVIAGVTALTLDLLWLVSRPIEPHFIDPWFGVYERILLSIPLAWMVVISARLLFLVRQQVRY
jgi:hypothetical membrane protein